MAKLIAKIIFFPVSWALNQIPQKAVLSLGDLLGAFWFHVVRFRRSTVLENLTLAFPNLSENQILELSRKNFFHYGRLIIETIQALSWTLDDVRKKITVHGLENVNRALEKGEGGLFLTLHLGNWEFAIQSAAAAQIPLDVVVKHARNELVQKFLEWYRCRTGAKIFLEEGTAKDILRSLRENRMVGFILDQFMGPPIGLPVRFFGMRAGTAVAMALMTEKRNTPIVPAYSYRDADGKLHTVFEKEVSLPELSDTKEDRLYQKTQCYNDVLESIIRKHPEQWLWIHRRWKEFKGEPRWLPTRAALVPVFTSLLFCALVACSSKPTTKTGIELPPDPTIAAPKFELTTEAQIPQGTNVGVVSAPTEPAKEKPSKKKKKEKKSAPPIPAIPAAQVPPTSAAKPAFQIYASDRIPFEIGEKMEISLNWMALPAGRVQLEVRPGPEIAGRKTTLLWGNVLSSAIVDTIYHVDNTIETFVDAQAIIPYKFLLHMFETHQKKETRVSFDHGTSKAFYWAKRISQRWGDQNIDRTDNFVPGSKDMFSAIYAARLLEFSLNQKQTVSVYENGENHEVELVPVANELVNSGAGTFQCWKLSVTVKLNNVLKPMGETYLWLSDDSKKYIVKFDAKIKIGSLIGSLSSLKEH